jgi:hypothetical protein
VWFYLGISLGLLVLAAHDVVAGKTTFGSFFRFASSTRRDNPIHFWITVAWTTLGAVAIALLAIYHLLPDSR